MTKQILKNATVGVIHLAGKPVLPKQTVEVDEAYLKNPVVAKLIARERLVRVEAPKTVKTAVPDADPVEVFEKLVEADAEAGKFKAFAKKNAIELGDAKTKEEIIAVIKACLTVQ